LSYASAKAGPNQGWANSTTQGAAITVWGRNLGSTRGSSFVTVAGVNLTSNASYAEWGATTNPTTAKGFQRITFWLNSSMPTGATTISVTVGGATSNTLPFTIDNTAANGIRFIDDTNGSESYDGQYPDHSLGGTHGPWLYVSPGNNWSAHAGVVPGSFLYMRGGTYSTVCPGGSYHCPASAIFGNSDGSGPPLVWYSGPFDGTDALRYTVTSYPGEWAHWMNTSIYVPSSYWTFANFTMDAVDTGNSNTNVYMAIEDGNPAFYCTNTSYRNNGNQFIGLEWTGYIHMPIQIWGLNTNVFASYFNNIPTAAGLGVADSYNFYLASSTGTTMKDNEMHRGAHFKGQIYDESRCSGSADADRGLRNVTFDSNWLDMNYSDGVSPQIDTYYGVIVGMGDVPTQTPKPDVTNVVIKNNVIYHTDGNHVYEGIDIHQETTSGTTYNSVYIYNNTLYNTGTCMGADFGANGITGGSNVYIENNICANMPAALNPVRDWYGASGNPITPQWGYNLSTSALNTSGAFNNLGHNLVADPGFVSTSAPDFHLSSSTSPAVGAGVAIPGVTMDFNGLIRPNPPAMGAYEFAAGSSGSLPSAPSGLIATVH